MVSEVVKMAVEITNKTSLIHRGMLTPQILKIKNIAASMT